MDEKQLEQLSSSSGIPLELLSRSIQARAESSGVTPADIKILYDTHGTEAYYKYLLLS